jgi:cation diffusion facilitator CzcD-associated flavoprotein CzcO
VHLTTEAVYNASAIVPEPPMARAAATSKKPPSPAARQTVHVLVVGAGPSGLAVAACLQGAGIQFALIERADRVGASWRHHYERLHLHTVKQYSALPFTPFPSHYPTYVARDQVVAYLEAYAAEHHLEPRLGEAVLAARPVGGGWEVETSKATVSARCLVVATGYNCEPKVPEWPGQEAFQGELRHSSKYLTGRGYRGQRVMVVGVGNSGGEIALDLWESGARVWLCARSPVHVVPRDFLGLPAQVSGLTLGKLPLALADAIGSRVSRMAFGDLSRYGLRRPEFGPASQVVKLGRVPLIDIGTVALIKQGAIQVVPGIERFTQAGVILVDGRDLELDRVILATGYRARLDRLLSCAAEVTDDRGYPKVFGAECSVPGLYFIGFRNPLDGQLHDIHREALAVAEQIRVRYKAGRV